VQGSAVPASLPREGRPAMNRLGAVAALALVLCGAAQASWSVDNSGTAAAAAKTMPAGNVPSGTVAGNAVTLTWTASTFADGGAVPSYVVRRFNSVTSAEETVLANCAGLVSATTCTENGVPTGTWRYTVTPAAGVWRGTQSAQSAVVTVLL
jgi:hypothetical protein